MENNKSFWELFRQKARIIIYGTNTFYGRLFDLVLLFLILASVILLMLETVKSIDRQHHTLLISLEWTITVFFTLEYLLRIISLDKPQKYIFSFFGIIDLMALLPMYLESFFGVSHAFAIIRVLRLLRLFKIVNHPLFLHQSSHLKDAMIASRAKIIIFIYFMIISTVIIGTIMYMVEGKESGFDSIPAGIYWCIVTLTTVGFGDITPVTPLGRFIASIVMIMGYGIIAVPTGIVTAEFSQLKSKLNPETKKERVCPECANTEHAEQAKYCQQCGAKL
jgi:voltage-gated potassium channel